MIELTQFTTQHVRTKYRTRKAGQIGPEHLLDSARRRMGRGFEIVHRGERATFVVGKI